MLSKSQHAPGKAALEKAAETQTLPPQIVLYDLACVQLVSQDEHNTASYRCLSDMFSKLSKSWAVCVAQHKCDRGFKTNGWILH